jgi:S-adenosylmethionine synthetase
MADYRYGQAAVRTGMVDIQASDPWPDNDTELIERKGIGHPDSICDALAALLSQAYSAYTMEHCDGLILHHQFDKVMLIGGRTEVDFGGGRFVEPITLVLAGRVSRTYLGAELPVLALLTDTVRGYFTRHFPMIDFDESVRVVDMLTSHAGPGTIVGSTGAIADMFAPVSKHAVRGYEELTANDTSYCVAYAPLSPLEQAVLDLERYLADPATHERHPWLGTDIKIMAYRQGTSVDLTMCIPQIAAEVHSHDEYRRNLDVICGEILDRLQAAIPAYRVRLSVNTKDRDHTRNVYLTVSGASLSGDIGVVGRGNRPNGLITARRPMSLEGTNGKNPRYYSGFIYAVAAKRLAKRIYDETGAANIVEIVAQNGGPLADPWHIRVTTLADRERVRAIVSDELAAVSDITRDFVAGELVNH